MNIFSSHCFSYTKLESAWFDVIGVCWRRLVRLGETFQVRNILKVKIRDIIYYFPPLLEAYM